MSKYLNTGNPVAPPRRSQILATRQSVDITKPKLYSRGVFVNKTTGAQHGPMIIRRDRFQIKSPA